MGKGKLNSKLREFIVLIIAEAVAFGVASWIVFEFFSASEVINNAIVTLFVFAVGITVLIYGNVTKNRNLNGLAFGIFLLGVFVVIDKYEGFAVKISAFATLAVTIAAFASIEESRRTRKDNIEREGREIRERLIDEVAKWLRELEGHTLAEGATLTSKMSWIEDRLKGSPAIGFEQWVKVDELDLASVELSKITEAMGEVDYYQKLTLQLDEGLSKLIGVVREKMKERGGLRSEHIVCLQAGMEKALGGQLAGAVAKADDRTSGSASEEDVISGKLKGNALALWESIQAALARAIEIKTSFIRAG
jgi:hypothetical protein